MITVKVSTEDGTEQNRVNVHGFSRLTPHAARAALEIAGFKTGRAWWDRNSTNGGDYLPEYGYRVYANSARKIADYTDLFEL